jgi:hypothetical protein
MSVHRANVRPSDTLAAAAVLKVYGEFDLTQEYVAHLQRQAATGLVVP